MSVENVVQTAYIHGIGEEQGGGGGHYMYYTFNMVLCPLSGNTDAYNIILCGYAKS